MTDISRADAPPWTVSELAAAVAHVLARLWAEGGWHGAGNGRVRDVPDVRAIRWYQTIGLMDRPAAMRGRTALYGERHLRQVVAVKRRQAAGRSLAEIQAELVGVTDEALAEVAGVPGEWLTAEVLGAGVVPPPAVSPAVPSPARPSGASGASGTEAASPPVPGEFAHVEEGLAEVAPRARFWARSASSSRHGPGSPPEAEPDPALTLSYGIGLAEGVTVLVDMARPPSPEEAAAIRAAAAPLLETLAGIAPGVTPLLVRARDRSVLSRSTSGRPTPGLAPAEPRAPDQPAPPRPGSPPSPPGIRPGGPAPPTTAGQTTTPHPTASHDPTTPTTTTPPATGPDLTEGASS